MNNDRRNNLKTMALLSTLIVSGLIVSACGGGSGGGSTQSAGIGGTGIVQGRVTGFGSIFINGQKFNTDSSEFSVDGNPDASQDDLAIGMIVTLEVEISQDAKTAEALNVIYDDEVQGPVFDLLALGAGETQRTFKVFGQIITIDDTSTLFEGAPANPGFGFDSIRNNDVVEISGFRTSANAISATYVEWKEALVDGSEVELRGTIGGYTPPTEQFNLDGFRIDFDSLTTEIDTPNGMLSNDMYVEVKGSYKIGPPVRIDADKIEFEDEEFGDEINDISLQGVISNFNGNDDFEIDGLPVDASGATELSPANVLDLLDDGVEIEVEGDIVAGKLIASEVELREGQTELRTTVSAIELPNRFQVEYPGQSLGSGLGTIWINADGQTLFEDEDDSAGKTPVENFSIDQLVVGNFVKIKGIAGSGEVTAQIVKRLDPDDSTKLQGAVEAFVRDVSITILGVEYPIDAGASYEDAAGNPLTNDQFFDQLTANPEAVVELEDDEPDADADEVEFDD